MTKSEFGWANLVIAPLILVLKVWSLRTLWAWFVVPTFGLPMLTVSSTLGLTLLVAAFKSASDERPTDTDEQRGAEFVRIFAVGIGAPLFSVGMGWLYLQIPF